MGGEDEGDRSEREITPIVDMAKCVDSHGADNESGDEISFRRVAHDTSPVRPETIVLSEPGAV
jgi:hypothetical protein